MLLGLPITAAAEANFVDGVNPSTVAVAAIAAMTNTDDTREYIVVRGRVGCCCGCCCCRGWRLGEQLLFLPLRHHTVSSSRSSNLYSPNRIDLF